MSVPKFTNASMLFADAVCSDKDLQYVRVVNKTANVTNGKALIRRFVEAPDGYYDIDIHGNLVAPSRKVEFGNEYPDIEGWRPPFEEMKPLCSLSNNDVQQMKFMCNACNKMNNDNYYMNLYKVIIGINGMYIGKFQHSTGGNCVILNNIQAFKHQFNLQQPAAFDSLYLGAILMEMLQYPMINLLKYTSATSPIIFGKDWGSCGMVSPIDCEVVKYG